MRLDTSLAIVLTQLAIPDKADTVVAAVVVSVEAAVVTLVEEEVVVVEDKNATNVVKLDTLLAIALRAVEMEVDMAVGVAVAVMVVVVAMAEDVVVVVEDTHPVGNKVKLVTHVVDMATCLATVLKVRSATTVSLAFMTCYSDGS